MIVYLNLFRCEIEVVTMLKHICLGMALWMLAAASYAEPFVFTAIRGQNEQRMQQRFGAVATYLQNALRVKVNYFPVKSQADAVTAFQNNQVQLAWLDGLSGIRARNGIEGAQVIAQGLQDSAAQTYFIAHISSGLRPNGQFPKGIQGKTFLFGAKESTSDHLIPEYYIRQAFGKAPKKTFRSVSFNTDSSRAIASLQAGAYQVGVIGIKVWERELANGKIDKSKVRVIWKTPPYSDYQWSVRGDVDQIYGQGFTARLKTVLLTLHERAPQLLTPFSLKQFIAADNEDVQPIYEVAKSIGLI